MTRTTLADEEQALLDEHIVAYRLDGPLVFAAAHAFLLELSEISDVRVVVLRLSHLDSSMPRVRPCSPTRSSASSIARSPSSCRASGADQRPILSRLGVFAQLALDRHEFDSTPAAIAHARDHAHRFLMGGAHPKDPPVQAGTLVLLPAARRRRRRAQTSRRRTTEPPDATLIPSRATPACGPSPGAHHGRTPASEAGYEEAHASHDPCP